MNAKAKVFLFVAAFILFLGVRHYVREKHRLNNFATTKAYVDGVTGLRNSAGTVFVEYKFKVNGVVYYSKDGLSCNRSLVSRIQNVISHGYIQIAYSKDNPDNCELLLKRNTFKKYKLQIPNDYSAIVDSIEAICSGN